METLSVIALAVQCGLSVEPAVMAAIVRVESRGNPHALSVNGDVELVRAPQNRDEAVAMARWLERHGYNFDAGLAQVNSDNLSRLGLDVATVFEPCANLRAASRVLRDCHERALGRVGSGERAAAAALSCYNTGDFTRGLRNGYVDAVRAGVPGPLVVQVAEPVDGWLMAKMGRSRPGSPPEAQSVALRATRPRFEVTRPEEVFGKRRGDVFGSLVAGAEQ